jgi:hypothetical protein
MEKILISGTGRCGTTFLIKLFSFLEFNTGFNRDNYKQFIFSNCNSGMERDYTDNYYILKSPGFVEHIEKIMKNHSIKIKTMIIPIRDFNEVALSRANNGNNPGGLSGATDKESQKQYYHVVMSNYLYFMTKYEINTIFLDFDKMVTDSKYLFNKLEKILAEKNIDYKKFDSIYNEVSLTSKPK